VPKDDFSCLGMNGPGISSSSIMHHLAQVAKANSRTIRLEALAVEVQEGKALIARSRFAAKRIQSAWLAYRGSPAHQTKIHHIVELQVGEIRVKPESNLNLNLNLR